MHYIILTLVLYSFLLLYRIVKLIKPDSRMEKECLLLKKGNPHEYDDILNTSV